MSTYKPLVTINGHVEQLDDPDGLSISNLVGVDYIDFDLTPNIPTHQTGRLHWHDTDGTLSLGMAGSEVELQIGQEHLILVKNITGNTINNGTPVYFTGVDSGRPTVATGNAARALNPVPSFIRGLMTETTANNSEGYMLVAGLMRDVDTANWAPNTQLFLSATAAGEYTNPRPEAPDNVRGIGVVIIQHATEGSILVSLDPIYDLEWGSNIYSEVPYETDQFLGWRPDNARYELLRSQRNFFNGTTRETFDAIISSADGVTIQFTLEQAGGGDLTLQFTDGDSQFICTPNAATINITPGTDTVPTGTMVWIPLSTKVLTTGSAWPSEEHIRICFMSVPSAQFVLDHGGPYVNQNWNDHLSDTTGTIGQGHLTHVTGKIRLALGASWYSGVNPDGADNYFTFATDSVTWKSTTGVIAQMHNQDFGAKDTANAVNIILVANDAIAPYTHVSNLFDIDRDSTGNLIGNNRYFSLIFWGVQNKSDQGSGVMVNLPAGNYTGESSAILDTASYDEYNFPREFTLDSGTAFLICRSTFKMGINGWTHVQTTDLRGKVPSNIAGGGGGGTTDHGTLGGLADDDHLQYALVDGTRDFTGNVTINGTLNTVNTSANVGAFTLVQANTAIQTPNIVSATGSVSFDNDHINTTGNISGNTIQVLATLSLVAGNIESVTGTVNFADDHLTTTGNITSSGTVNAAGFSAGGTDGATANVAVDYSGGTRTLQFVNGLYTGHADS